MKYQISDMKMSLLSDYPELEAKSSREAIEKYLLSIHESVKFKRSGSTYVRFSATPINGNYKIGRKVWFAQL